VLSRICIERPILASVLSIILTLAGAVAMFSLPIAQYPEITPPQVTVSASYAGADAETVASSVAAPIETQITGVDNLLYTQSTSSNGQMQLTAYFDIGTDPDTAQVQVQNRVALATPQLPDAVKQVGVVVGKRSSSMLMLIAVYSPGGRFDQQYVGNYTNLYVLDAIKRIDGANQASVLGAVDLAMRVWLRPDRMASLGITPTDVQRAVSSQNRVFSAGSIGQDPNEGSVQLTFPVVTEDRADEPAEFENLILRASEDGSAIVRLRDVGRAEEGLKQYNLRGRFDGEPAALIAVYQQPGSNAIEVSKQVRQTLESLSVGFPEGLSYAVAMDTTEFVQDSIDEVVKTLGEAIVLVILVVFLFLQNLRATLIPSIAVVVSLVATFVGMVLLGFSINLLTLFGLVLAVGIVVDDAIVVVENVERNMSLGLPPKEAAIRAMEEVTGPVITIVLVLAAVFVPVAFLGGTTGLLYQQFAVTVAISVAISGFVALTLTPALSALILKPHHGEPHRFFRAFNRRFDALVERFGTGVSWTLARSGRVLLAAGVMLAAIVLLFRAVPGSFVPPEDQGYLFGVAFLPDAASLDRTEALTRPAGEMMRGHPAIEHVTEAIGFSTIDGTYKPNAATLFVSLRPAGERDGEENSSFGVIAAVTQGLAQIKEGVVLLLNPPSIPGLGGQGGFEFWLQSRGTASPAELGALTRAFIGQAAQRPELRGVSSTFNPASRQLKVLLDREKAETLGVPVQDVYDALQTLFGSLYVSQYDKYSRVWQVILQAEPRYREDPEDIAKVFVRTKNGNMVPLSALVTTGWVAGPDAISRFNGFPAAKILGDAAEGYSSGDAIRAMEEVAATVLPEGFSYEWSGQALEEKKSGGTSAIVFAFGLIMVFLILAAQYESWSLPTAVIAAVPFGIFGALLAVLLRGLENDVYFQIGLVTLIGLAAKNAILIVEFAVIKLKEGLPAREAAIEAAKMRLRPIIMTSAAFILGAVPLAIATGAGANSRHSIGTGIIGGMVAATTLALFFVPLMFNLLEGRKPRTPDEGASAPAGHAPGSSGEPT